MVLGLKFIEINIEIWEFSELKKKKKNSEEEEAKEKKNKRYCVDLGRVIEFGEGMGT